MLTPRCKAVERTSAFVRSHFPSRGCAGPEALAGFVSPSRVTKTRCDAQEREGVRPSAQCAHDNEVCGSVRGGDWDRRKTVRTFTRVGPVRSRACLWTRVVLGSLARAVLERGGPRPRR